MNEIIDVICRFLNNGEDLVVATIISHKGSTPRTAGTKMVVRKNGEFFGTIGGGKVESDLLKTASDVYVSGKPSICYFDMTHDTVSGMDMICGGNIEVLLDLFRADPEKLEIVGAIQNNLLKDTTCFLVTALGSLRQGSHTLQHVLMESGGVLRGNTSFPSSIIDTLCKKSRGIQEPTLFSIDQEEFWIEPYVRQSIVYIFGAGHVSMPTALFCLKVGFQVVVIDDRKEFANPERFPKPALTKAVSDFNNCINDFSIDEKSYLVIMTRGHLYDKIVLTQALSTQAGYIGMMGSKRKRKMIFNKLLEEGFTQDDLKRVHTPIGLDIGAETPEEIAVSITAELILVRSKKAPKVV